MHRHGDVAKANAARYGYTSPEAVRARVQAREAREDLLRLLDTTPDDLVAAYSLSTEGGRNALALGRY